MRSSQRQPNQNKILKKRTKEKAEKFNSENNDLESGAGAIFKNNKKNRNKKKNNRESMSLEADDDDKQGNQSEASESSEDENSERLKRKKTRKERIIAESNQKTEKDVNKQEQE